jgi:hypothetical protein
MKLIILAAFLTALALAPAALRAATADTDSWRIERPGLAIIVNASIGGDSDIANMASVCPTLEAERAQYSKFENGDDPHYATRGCRLVRDATAAHILSIAGPMGTGSETARLTTVLHIRIDATGYEGYIEDAYTDPRPQVGELFNIRDGCVGGCTTPTYLHSTRMDHITLGEGATGLALQPGTLVRILSYDPALPGDDTKIVVVSGPYRGRSGWASFNVEYTQYTK